MRGRDFKQFSLELGIKEENRFYRKLTSGVPNSQSEMGVGFFLCLM